MSWCLDRKSHGTETPLCEGSVTTELPGTWDGSWFYSRFFDVVNNCFFETAIVHSIFKEAYVEGTASPYPSLLTRGNIKLNVSATPLGITPLTSAQG